MTGLDQKLVTALVEHEETVLQRFSKHGVSCRHATARIAARDIHALREQPSIAGLLLCICSPQAPEKVQELAAGPIIASRGAQLQESAQLTLLLCSYTRLRIPSCWHICITAFRSLIIGIVRRQLSHAAKSTVKDSSAERDRGISKMYHGAQDHGPDRIPDLTPLLWAAVSLLPVCHEESRLCALHPESLDQATLFQLFEKECHHLSPQTTSINTALSIQHNSPLAQQCVLCPFSNFGVPDCIEDSLAREDERLIYTAPTVLFSESLGSIEQPLRGTAFPAVTQ
mmetsp:Transcript_41179/g.76600  ORF Transcript_41179/g.76600 Transcript_41179/m.76600 type:complete len:284 (-) Transcript_41179:21-872(-)